MEWPRIALAQFDPAPGNVTLNVKRMADMVRFAAGRGAELVVFPEESVSGYCIGDHNRNRVLLAEGVKAVQERLAPACDRAAAVVGLLAPERGLRLNDGAEGARDAYLVLGGGKVIGGGCKTLLVDDGVLSDSRYFLAGDADALRPVAVPLPGGRVLRLGVLVCQDMWDDHYRAKPAAELKRHGAELLVTLNASPFHVGKLGDRIAVASRRVRETGLPLAYVNTVGVQDNGKNVIVLDGGSFVMDGDGTLLAQYPQFEEGVYQFDGVHRAVDAGPPRVEELFHALVFALRGFFTRSGHTGAVIGLSGGIDSALSAFLLTQALGSQNVLGLNMPSRFSSRITQDLARDLSGRLGIEYVVHPIEEVVAHKLKEYVQVAGQEVKPLTAENIQARERGSILMTHAQQRGRLVVGNGNKTEFQRGYATLYGDIVGAVMPLGDVAKTDVYRLVRFINERYGGPIPEGILAIPPSAELSEAQDVNQGLGDPFDYDVEAPLGVELIENERTPAELGELFRQRGLDAEIWAPVRSAKPVYDKMTAEAFEKMAWEVFLAIEGSAFKRIQAPPIIKLTRKAFGFDYRESVFTRLKV
jgi:NAD+ synthase (glutamine-hydrolysing)